MIHKTRPWWIYQGHGKRNENNTPEENDLARLGEPPPWRRFGGEARRDRGTTFDPEIGEIDRINTALLLRRPLLVTGRPGTGKTSLTYAVAHELGLEPVLRWSVTSRTALHDGLYRYDAIGRLQDTQRSEKDRSSDIADYLTLGPLGTAFFAREHKTQQGETVCYPRILLIDEIDKSDIDLPNDLLHLFEEGEFEIPELARLKPEQYETNSENEEGFFIQPADFSDPVSFFHNQKVFIPADGRVHCRTFPLVIMTSNGEREFPPAFMRRCLQLEMQLPDKKKLERIVEKHFALHHNYKQKTEDIKHLIRSFTKRRDGEEGKEQNIATDQLLNAVYLVLENIDPNAKLDKETLADALWKPLSGMEDF
ncbi:MAG: MoxR family ATPase [Gammaproteobacteria bacterium]|nr:MoxR family ATPase [Gammaproteobacteria bacterium]